jgi:hypothetical protein
MPAPDREMPKQSFTTSVAVPRGLWGYYTDAEVDAMLAALPTGGGAVDLSAYATTAYVDGQVATVYTKAEVDAAIAAAVAAIQPADLSNVYTKPEVDAAIAAAATGDVDLSAYATAEQLDGVKTEIMTAATAAFQERYTKPEVDSLFVKQADMVAPPSLDGYATEQYVDDSIARIPAVDAYTKTEVDAKVNVLALDIQAVNDQTAAHFQLFSDGLQPTFDAKADKATTYTKAEVDAKIPATGGSVDLTAYAKLNDTAQAITAKSATAETFSGVAFQFIKENASSTAFALADVDGQERPVYAVGSKKFPLAFTTETTGSGSVDLTAYAKLNDPTQTVFAKGIVADVFAFDLANGLRYIDTAEGYGPRLYFISNATGLEEKNPLVYVSDLEPLNALLPRIETLESKAAPVPDLAGYVTATGLATELLVYGKTADIATFVQTNYASKSETYTKAEVDDRLLQVPSPMKYLQWGGAFQKMPAGNAKDKWFAAGLVPSIQIVKGKHYRLEMTTKFGPFNTDVKEAWVGFRFNYKTLNELPCTKQPLVTMSGWGTTTVTRARAAISTNAVATTTPTRADRFRFNCVDDWTSAEDIIEYAVEFEADQDIASANFVPEICFGGAWLTFPTNFEGVVAVIRQMD